LDWAGLYKSDDWRPLRDSNPCRLREREASETSVNIDAHQNALISL
jgi:hypothetical protein